MSDQRVVYGQWSPIGLGLLLGFLNVALISIGISLSVGEGMNLAVFVFMFGIIPGIGLGAILGLVAQSTPSWPRWVRVAILSIPALALVGLLGSMFELSAFIVMCSIPTVVAALILERATRLREEPPVPPARVESSAPLVR